METEEKVVVPKVKISAIATLVGVIVSAFFPSLLEKMDVVSLTDNVEIVLQAALTLTTGVIAWWKDNDVSKQARVNKAKLKQ